MKLAPNIYAAHVGLVLKKQRTLIISDVHLGIEEELSQRGVLIPRFHFKDVLQQIDKTIDEVRKVISTIDTIVINGDLKHEFGRISEQEWREILKLFDTLSKHCKTLVLVKGNHDIMIAPLARKRSLTVVDDYYVDDVVVTHGHNVPASNEYKRAKTIIIGNEHPAIAIKDNVRNELFKCFLKGTFQKKSLFVLPSMNPTKIGTDVRSRDFLSPYLHQSIDSFQVFIVGDKTYDFGTISRIEAKF